ncbi:hypothetical protein F53441_6134 [Fusarium austroafricanum]|uniref:Uncharacterized protein n=1 Tax=Fusarium austroafricanum TaxID=2364996 RepID=A0A8H4KGI2_9HYPO|nr:hypothetical protein F53441_6134 [Fusarium austroafricanum]
MAPISTPPFTPKRKRTTSRLDSTACDVVKGINKKSRYIKKLGRDIEKLAAKLKARAQRAADDPQIDCDDLRESWETLRKLIKSRTKTKHLQRRVEVQRAHIQKTRFNFHIGDWVHDLHDRVKAGENDNFLHNVVEKAKTELKKRMPAAEAKEEAEKFRDFRAAAGLRVSDTFSLVQPEFKSVMKWRADGGTGEDAPATPYLDRIGKLCDRIALNRKLYIELLDIGDQRDSTAHHPQPHLKEYMDEHGVVDWVEVKAYCDKKKRRFRSQFMKGKFTQLQYTLYERTLDTWFKAYVSGWNPDSTPILVTGVDAALKKVKQQTRRGFSGNDSIPESPYVEGKWDDLF